METNLYILYGCVVYVFRRILILLRHRSASTIMIMLSLYVSFIDFSKLISIPLHQTISTKALNYLHIEDCWNSINSAIEWFISFWKCSCSNQRSVETMTCIWRTIIINKFWTLIVNNDTILECCKESKQCIAPYIKIHTYAQDTSWLHSLFHFVRSGLVWSLRMQLLAFFYMLYVSLGISFNVFLYSFFLRLFWLLLVFFISVFSYVSRSSAVYSQFVYSYTICSIRLCNELSEHNTGYARRAHSKTKLVCLTCALLDYMCRCVHVSLSPK